MAAVLDPVWKCVGGPLDGEKFSIEDMTDQKLLSGGYVLSTWTSKKPGSKPETVFKWVPRR